MEDMKDSSWVFLEILRFLLLPPLTVDNLAAGDEHTTGVATAVPAVPEAAGAAAGAAAVE